MIVYIAARLFCALYGLEWPLSEANRSFFAFVSAVEFISLSALAICTSVFYITEKWRKGNE